MNDITKKKINTKQQLIQNKWMDDYKFVPTKMKFYF